MSGLSRRQAAILAALLDADGATLTYAELGWVVESRGVGRSWSVIGQYVVRLRALGLTCIERVIGRGLRLTEIPPDWALEDVLAMLDTMRRDGYEPPAATRRRVA